MGSESFVLCSLVNLSRSGEESRKSKKGQGESEFWIAINSVFLS